MGFGLGQLEARYSLRSPNEMTGLGPKELEARYSLRKPAEMAG